MPFYPLITEKQTFFDANSNELSGGKLFIYQANTTTKVTTYAETDGLSANSNPIVLNSRGEVPNGLYVAGGIQYKLVLTPSTDTDPPTSPIWTRDDLDPLGYVAPLDTEWVSSGAVATQINTTTFNVPGDQRGVFQVGRRVKAQITAPPGATYGTVFTASFGAGVTTVTLTPIVTALDAGMTGSIPDVGLLTADNPSVPALIDSAWQLLSAGDKTKKFGVSLLPISPGQTRTRSIYDKSGYDTVANDIWGLHNCALNASVSGNNLVLELRTNAGAVPSASDPAIVGFRNASFTSGTPSIIAVTAATTFTISAGSTLGFANNEGGRIWVCAILNPNLGGTVELACYRAWNGTGWRTINEGVLNTTGEGSGTADSAQVLYSATARTNVPMRYLGYLEIAYGTAAWSNAPTFVQTNHSRMPLPGDIVQKKFVSNGAYDGPYLFSIPNDNTIPQEGEGYPFIATTFAATSAINLLEIEAQGMFTTNAAGEYITATIGTTGVGNVFAASVSSQNSADPQMQKLFWQYVPGTTGALTYFMRAGTANGANNIQFNGWGGGGQRGGVMNSYLQFREVFV